MSDAFEGLEVRDGEARGVVRRAHAEHLCAGHFPGDPLVPGAYLVALMAEVAARLAPGQLREIDRCVFRARVRPDVEIRVRARRAPAGDVVAEVRTPTACAARARLRFGAAP